MHYGCYRSKRACILGLVCIVVFCHYTWFSKHNRTKFYSNLFFNTFYYNSFSAEQKSKNRCQVPELNPFNASIFKLVSEITKPLDCEIYHTLLFNSSINPHSHLIPVKTYEQYKHLNILSCHYRIIYRGGINSSDKSNNLGAKLFPVRFIENTTIPGNVDAVAIFCVFVQKVKNAKTVDTRLVDIHAFIQVKHSEQPTGIFSNGTRFNVILLGVDSTSRMGFYRNFPKSRQYLLKNLSAVEMTAYHKIGDNTFPNIAPMLTNLQAINEAKLACEHNLYFDQCPFIWKPFSNAGYKTLYAEDDARLWTWNNMKNGFKKQPTDYYPRAVFQAADKGNILHDRTGQGRFHGCLGPRPVFEVLVNYMQQLSWQMTHGPQPGNYFQFGFTSTVTHDLINGGRLIDSYLLEALQWWHLGGYLNNTVLVLFSDHGLRAGTFRRLFQGQIEDRLPFMFFVMPPQFPKLFPEYWENLVSNRDALVTGLDLHQTLLDILYLGNPYAYVAREYESLHFGRSLFSPINPNRTCQMAGVSEVYCACTQQVTTLPLKNSLVKHAVYFAISWVNKVLEKFRQCRLLSVGNIFEATETQLSPIKTEMEFWKGFRVGFQTKPGNATMEAFVMWNGFRRWKVSGDVLRTNLYGNQSHCVQNARAKKYCYCKNLIK